MTERRENVCKPTSFVSGAQSTFWKKINKNENTFEASCLLHLGMIGKIIVVHGFCVGENRENLENWRGEVRNLEGSNVERPIFRNFKITNIKIAKDELFDFIYDFFFIIIFLKLLQHSKYLIIFPNYNIF